jgi:restriction endonuclease Mrr
MTRASGDGGVEATLDHPIVGGRHLFQCKRLAPDALVGSPTVRGFYGALVADRKGVKGILITTSGFRLQAREFAQNLPIELIDGEGLSRLISDGTTGENQ